jgi:hypothetical protein
MAPGSGAGGRVAGLERSPARQRWASGSGWTVSLVANDTRVISTGLDAAGRWSMIVRGPPRMGPKLLAGGGPKRRVL